MWCAACCVLHVVWFVLATCTRIQGPSAAELAAMPALHPAGAPPPTESTTLDEELALGMVLMEGGACILYQLCVFCVRITYTPYLSTGSPPPNVPVSFARITRMGFAATGPALADAYGTSPPDADAQTPAPAVALAPAGAWGARSRAASDAAQGTEQQQGREGRQARRGGRHKPVVLLSSAHRTR